MEDITRAMPAGEWVIAENESFLMPLEEPGNPPPVYPDILLSRRLAPQVVCLQVSVGDDGRVSDASLLSETPDCRPAAPAPEFFDAARAAVMVWRFDPAFRCVYESVAAKAAAGDGCLGGEERPVAVSLAYRFVFEQQDGKGSVRMGP